MTKIMLLAAAAVLGSGIGSAYAESEGGPIANSQFTEMPGFIAHAPAQNVPPAAVAQQGQQRVQVYGTHSSYGTWLFAPRDLGGANS